MTLFEEALMQFEEAHDDYAFRGTKRPEEVPDIERRYQRKKQALLDYVQALEANQRTTKPERDPFQWLVLRGISFIMGHLAHPRRRKDYRAWAEEVSDYFGLKTKDVDVT